MKTANTLPSNVKKVSIETLNANLADGLDLALAIKQAHWNLKGSNFIAVHELLDTLRGEIDTHNDTMAERVAQLGAVALGTTQAVAKSSSLKPYPTDIHKSTDHVAALVERFAEVSEKVRKSIDEVDDAGDPGTADIYTAYSRALDKALWFLESHLQ